MGSGGSKNTPPSSKPPPTKESPSCRKEESKFPHSPTHHSPPLPKSEAKKEEEEVGSPCPSTQLDPAPKAPEQTAADSVSEKKHVGSAGSAVPSSKGDAPASNPETQNEVRGEKKPEEKDAGKESATASLTPSASSAPPAPDTAQDNTKKTTTTTTTTTTTNNKNMASAQKKGGEKEAEGRLLPEASELQIKLDSSLRMTNALVRQEGLMGAISEGATRLTLRRAPPGQVSLQGLVAKLENLEVLDVSDNQMGPQGVRVLCLALPPGCPVVSLSLAGNKTDTDTAVSVGRLLSEGPALEYLDVSSNYLGKDYFSRCAGQALKTNTCLRTLRAQSIGMVDAKVLLEGLQENHSLVELDLSNNQITNRQALGSSLGAVLKKADCSLQSLALAGCDMNKQGLTTLAEGLAANTSLCALNLNNNEFGSLQTLMSMVIAAVSHPSLVNLHLNDARISDQTLTDIPPPTSKTTSHLEVLSLNSSNVTEEFWSKMAAAFGGRLRGLVDVDISNNSGLTAASVEHLWALSADDSGHSGILKLTTAMNDMNQLPSLLTADRFPRLAYLNTRRVRFSADALGALAERVTSSSSSSPSSSPSSSSGGLSLTTLVWDGIKLSGKKGLATLLGSCSSSKITALSLSACSLTDADLLPLAQALGSGFMLHMLKLSANRLTGALVAAMVENLLKCRQHPLGVLDMSENQITDAGAKALCGLYAAKDHSSGLHSVNLSNNALGKEGIMCLLSCMGGNKFPLKCLYVNSQTTSFLEADTEEIYVKTASVLGYTVERSGETIKSGCSNLPPLPNGFAINLRGLGGHAGQLGPFLDCPAIVTDASTQRLVTLTLENVLDICASLQGQKSGGQCVVSKEMWVHITGSDKDNSIPSWLQLEDCRCKGVYLSNLPGNSTAQRLEALFDTEADCNIEEVFLVKDPVTKNNSGTAWVLFSDQPSVDRALQLYTFGQAQIFGTPFTVSRLRVHVEESTSSEASDQARQDVAARQKARAAEDRAHRLLIQQNTEESWKRHAYRLAHPAYADGRIW